MDKSVTPPQRPTRPGLWRSYSASPQLSPPAKETKEKKAGVAQVAARKLHLPGHSRGESQDQSNLSDAGSSHAAHKHRKLAHANPKSAARHTGHAIADVAKATASSGSGHHKHHHANGSETTAIPPAGEAAQAPTADAPSSRPVKPSDVATERKRRERRQSELQRELSQLRELASSSTGELDDTYYGLLEKAFALRELIGGLQSLSSRSRSLQKGFSADTRALTDEINGQTEGVKGFSVQQHQVDEMESRIRSSKDKAKQLSERLEAARRKADEWGKQEADWQAQTSKKIQLGWACLGVALFLLAMVVVIKSLVAPEVRFDGDGAYPSILSKDWDVFKMAVEKLSKLGIARRPPQLDDDPRLRLFDEL